MQDKTTESDLLLVETLLKCSNVINKISQALTILVGKRATIEEKMIRTYLAQLASAQAQIIAHIASPLAACDLAIDSAAIEKANALAECLAESLEKLLKAATYDLNYLEQYFEHAFYAELRSSSFLEDSLATSMALSCLSPRHDAAIATQAETE